MTDPIHFTPAARQELQRIISLQEIPADHFLRIGIRGGGCGGMSYLLGFDSQKEEDHLHEVEGMKVLIDKRHGMYVLGMEIDFLDEAEQRGFVFNNPAMRKEE